MIYSVTGATGLLGNNLIRVLLDAGHDIRVGTRVSSDLKPFKDLDPARLTIIKGELTDPGFARDLLDGSHGLLHCAGYIWFGKRNLEKSLKVNRDGSLNLADQCIQNGIRMIYVSTTDALAAGKKNQPADESCLDPVKGKTSYVVSKRIAERKLLARYQEKDLDLVIVNPGLILGPNDWKPSTGKMILAMTDGFIPLAPGGGISVADARNVSRAMLAGMDLARSGERYILAGQNMTYVQLWRMMSELVGRRLPLTRMRPGVGKVVGWAGDALGKIRGIENNVNSAAISLGARWNYYSSQKAIDELGYEICDPREALRDSWNWLRKNGYSKKFPQ